MADNPLEEMAEQRLFLHDGLAILANQGMISFSFER